MWPVMCHATSMAIFANIKHKTACQAIGTCATSPQGMWCNRQFDSGSFFSLWQAVIWGVSTNSSGFLNRIIHHAKYVIVSAKVGCPITLIGQSKHLILSSYQHTISGLRILHRNWSNPRNFTRYTNVKIFFCHAWCFPSCHYYYPSLASLAGLALPSHEFPLQ